MKVAKRRRAYTTAELREVRTHYTEGLMHGREMSRRLGRSYLSFRQFIMRHPELRKTKKKEMLPIVDIPAEGTT
ncbi:hypothetical protein MKJ04_11460 [Pontibacter sp. E15-1]|uniref:hypothetical protein n=1 Tax=Pontibacter sp. E15-1 TaxID=2919918 RepID=UPI001F4F26F4|nr:hypothetical protein [Pontibacter sp. E15-1]MCJ8165461.1 hypothetical protein [Pontibacter sp. E15-1]